MSEQSSYNQFTVADIERYHNGQMTAQEMHALEKAALDDPFLADALEGYVYTKTPVQDVKELKEKLLQRTDRGKVIVLNNRRPAFLKIAAMLVLLAGLGWVAYQFAFVNNNNEIAKTQKQETPATDEENIAKEDNEPSAPLSAADSNYSGNATSNLAVTPQAQKEAPSSATQREKETVAAGEGVQQDQGSIAGLRDDRKSDTANAITIEATAAAPAANRQARKKEANILSGKIVDAKDKAVPYATIINKENSIVTQSDRDGNFKLPVTDSVVDVTINSAGYQSNMLALNARQQGVKITLQEQTNSLNEVVVSSKSKQPFLRQQPRFTVENAEPAEGWAAFNRYVADSLEEEGETDMKLVKGEVKLSFDVNAQGKPVNIKVEKSLCGQCDEEAIRILKESPRWRKDKKKKKAVARIKF